jgi:hypothetical protein
MNTVSNISIQMPMCLSFLHTYWAYCLIKHTDIYPASLLMASNSEREKFYINQKDRSDDDKSKEKGRKKISVG